MLSDPDYQLESLLLALLSAGKEQNILVETDEIDQGEISEQEYYRIYLAALLPIARQLELSSAALHALVNQHFPVVSPWCPVLVPPHAPGTYWLAPAYTPGTRVQARWRPQRGQPWGQWHAVPVGRVRQGAALALQPGDRWRNL